MFTAYSVIHCARVSCTPNASVSQEGPDLLHRHGFADRGARRGTLVLAALAAQPYRTAGSLAERRQVTAPISAEEETPAGTSEGELQPQTHQ